MSANFAMSDHLKIWEVQPPLVLIAALLSLPTRPKTLQGPLRNSGARSASQATRSVRSDKASGRQARPDIALLLN